MHVITRRSSVALALSALALTLTVVPTAAAAPTFEAFSDPPTDDVVVDCGSYHIREVATFSATLIHYPDGTTRMHAVIDGWLYRSDDRDTVIGREHAVTVRLIEGTVAMVTGNRWHVVLYGEGISVHDVGRLVFDFTTREVFAESGNHPVFDGEFDFATLCDL
ncbi:MAG TPA: hypothetical protein VFC71_11865 [Candidatus Polarisedimenticolia bacterium]|nr:hypothetical protein [Candidatus Polarisedimenticolia bacterium]